MPIDSRTPSLCRRMERYINDFSQGTLSLRSLSLLDMDWFVKVSEYPLASTVP